MKNYLFLSLLLSICVSTGCSSSDSKQPEIPDVEIPSVDELTSIQVGLVAYYTFNNETGNDGTSHHYDAALINHPEIIADTPSGKGKSVCLKKEARQYINIPYQLFKNTTYSATMWIKDFEQAFFSLPSILTRHWIFRVLPPEPPVENSNSIPTTAAIQASRMPFLILSAVCRTGSGT